MATSDIKIALDTYFNDGWGSTPIQFENENLDTTGIDAFISIMFSPVENVTTGLNGTANGRIRYSGLYQIFCYAKNTTKALILADEVKTFLNGKQFNGSIAMGIGQDGSPRDLGNGFIEIKSSFEVDQWAHYNQSEDYLINNYGITDEEGNFLTDEDGTYLLQEF